MAEPLSQRELLEGLSLDKPQQREALLNGPTEANTFLSSLKRNATGLYSNINNLTGNLADLLGGNDNTNILNSFSGIQNNPKLNEFDKALESGKAYFNEPTTKGGLGQLLDLVSPELDSNLKSGRAQAELEHQKYNTQQQLAGQYANGVFGDMVGEMVMAIPIMKYGNMAKTVASLQTAETGLQTAKAIAIDSIQNAGVLSSTELLLGKAYGKSDDEAIANAVMAGAIGLLGTPIIGGAMKLGNKAIKAEEQFINEQAGGGVPTRQQQADLDEINAKRSQMYDEPASPIQEQIKPEFETQQTKTGRTIEADRKYPRTEYDIVEPRAEVGNPLEDQTYIPEVNNPKSFKYGFDDRGRVYAEESSSLGPQGGATQKASLKQVEQPKIDNPIDEVNRRLEFYDRDERLRERYGQTQASYKYEKDMPESQSIANRLQFEKEQYKDIMKNESGELYDIAKDKLTELRKTKVEDYVATQKQIDKAKELFDNQTKILDTKSNIRDIEMKQEFKSYNDAQIKTNAKDFQYDQPTKPFNEIVSKVISKAKIKLPEAKQATREVAKKEALAGRKFDIENITDAQRKKYRDEVAVIEEVQWARQDLDLLKKGEISQPEFIYRERRRLDNKIEREGQPEFKSPKEVIEYKKTIISKYNDIGVHVKETDIQLKKEPSGKAESPENKAIREKKEIQESKQKNLSTIESLNKYKETGEVPRLQSGERKGQEALSKSQIEDIDREILTVEEIANKTSPIGTVEEIKDLRTKYKESANLKTTLETRKQLGIKDDFAQKAIKFKDTLLDASNSVAQVTTVLLSSKRLAKLSKLYGGTTDIRTIVGAEMNKLLPKDFPISASKSSVKPLFMTENYGQGSRGLIRNLMKEHNVSKEVATEFFNAYEKAFDSVSPEMLELRKAIYGLMSKNPTGVFGWTLPDGFRVEFKLQKKLDGEYSIKGKNIPFKITTNSLDEFSRALMPNLIHSIDGYVASEMKKLGIETIHDAFMTPAGKTDKFASDAYGEIMSKINDSNLLDNIMKELGYEGHSLKQGDLESSIIKESAGKSALAVEEKAGDIISAKERTIDVSKSNTPDEVMKEYMATENVREGSFNSIVTQMTNEAGYRTMSLAREGDDVFTRQVALAHQSPKYNQSKSIEAPSGVDKATWNNVQEQIFNEARARLEYNPLLVNTIKGERKFFDIDGNHIGSNDKTFKTILKEVQEFDRQQSKQLDSISKDNAVEFKKVTEKDIPQKEELSKQVKETFKNIDETKVELGIQGGKFNETINNWKAGFESEGVYGQINKLNQMTRNTLNESAKVGQVVKNSISDMYKKAGMKDKNEFDTSFQRSVLDTDYVSLNMNRDETLLLMSKEKSLYNSLKKEIDQSAKGMKNKGEMNHPDFYPNAHLLAISKNIPLEKVDIIDKMISIKAMSDRDWKFIETHSGTELFDTLSIYTQRAKQQTLELFKDDIVKATKGYRLETYDSLYKMKEGKLQLDLAGGMEQGALPVDLMSKKVGNRDFDAKVKGQSKAEYEAQALEEGLGLVFDRSANPIGLRKVASEVEREAMGRQISAMETLSATLESNTRKLLQTDSVIQEIKQMLKDGNDLFSKVQEKDFVALTKEEIKSLPKDIQDIRFVNQDFKHMLMGNAEIQIFKEGSKAVIEQIYKDGFVHFKQNVVLKNPASWINNYMFGLVMNVNAGMSPKKAFQYSKAGPAIYKEMQNLTEELIEHDLKGTLNSNRALAIKAKLDSNEIYQMVQNGMAVSVMADMIKTSSKAHLFTDKAVGKGLRKIIGDKATEALSNVYIHSSSKTGRIANSMFARIDVMHRYALTKHALETGSTMEEAVMKSNGVYGDLDLISPMWSQAIQNYGAVPFSNWFFRVSGGLQDTTRKNIMRTIVLSSLIYGASEYSGKRTESFNPLLTLVNTPFDFITMSPITRPINTVKNISTPKVYDKIGKAISNGNPSSIAITENFK